MNVERGIEKADEREKADKRERESERETEIIK